MTQLAFGQGVLSFERIDLGSTSGVGPIQFGVLQDCTIDFDWTTKELYGLNQFPVAIARATAKITGKARAAQILGQMYSGIFFGRGLSAGGLVDAILLEAQTVPATSPYQVTVNQASAYQDDIGVKYSVTPSLVEPPLLGNAPSGTADFTRVTTPTVAGQYSVNLATGVYTFSAADANATVLVSYAINAAAAKPQIQITNQPQGVTPVFKSTFQNQFGGKKWTLRLDACTGSKLSLPNRLSEWEIQEFDFQAFSDAAGNVGYFTFDQ